MNPVHDWWRGALTWRTALLVPISWVYGLLMRCRAALYGALFGLCAYATYDLSNLATLRGWPVSVTVVDMAWGAVVTAAATMAAAYAGR